MMRALGATPWKPESRLAEAGDDAGDHRAVADVVTGAVTGLVHQVEPGDEPAGQARVLVGHTGVDDRNRDAAAPGDDHTRSGRRRRSGHGWSGSGASLAGPQAAA